MIKNKKGITTLELLAYISIVGVIVSVLFMLITHTNFFYNKTSETINIIDEGVRHFNVIENNIEDRGYTLVEYCKTNDNVSCVLFISDTNTVKIEIKEINDNYYMYLNNIKITSDKYPLEKNADIVIDEFHSINSRADSAVVVFKFTITRNKYSRDFMTSIKI